MALSLSCPKPATLTSGYIVLKVNRTDVPLYDLPPIFGTQLNSLSAQDASIANWGAIPPPLQPTPTRGTYDPSVTYALGDTVASSVYSITTNPNQVYALSRTGWGTSASDASFGAAANAIDGDLNTWWETAITLPQWLVLDMLTPQTFNQVWMWPRTDGFNDTPGSIEIYVSNDGVTWGSPVYTQSGMPIYKTVHQFSFATQTARYLKYNCLAASAGARGYTSVAEIYVMGVGPSAGTLLHPIVYRSLVNGNKGNAPENWDGNWTCGTQPPHADVTNSSYQTAAFGYILAAFTKAALGSATWVASLGHSLSWDAFNGPPGDIVNMVDVYVKLNYTVSGGGIISTISRPLTNSLVTGTQGQILFPGPQAQFQCWHTSGGSTTPTLTLNGFDTNAFVDGSAPGGTVGVAYIAVYAATGGVPPYTYAVVGGALPPGLTLDPSLGAISGTPTTPGTFDFTVQVTDSTSATATASCAAPIASSGGGGGGGPVAIIPAPNLPVIPLPDPRRCHRKR